MELRILCREAGIVCPEYEGSIEITKIVSDSRRACDGCLYVAIRGLHHDGHLFIREALSAGASAIVVEEGAHCGREIYDASAQIITVPGTRHSLACLSDAWYGFPSRKMKLIAVTGTNGKTSVTHILKAIFEAAMYRCGLIGTVSCLSGNRRLFSENRDKLANMTTPDPEELYALLAEMAADNVEYVFIEATSHALHLEKLASLKFEAGIFTNLTPEHLDFHGTMEKYLASKQKLFGVSSLAVINADSEYYNNIAASCTGRIISCSATGRAADYSASDISDDGIDGISYTLTSARSRVRIKAQMPGKFNVMNTLEAAALAAALHLEGGRLAGIALLQTAVSDVPLEGVEVDFVAESNQGHGAQRQRQREQEGQQPQ